MHKLRILYFIAISSLSCKTAVPSTLSEEDHQGYDMSLVNDLNALESDLTRQIWQDHVQRETSDKNTSGRELQPHCQPRFYPASRDVPRKGMVVYYHGFTACPQQYFAIAPHLAMRGYDVFLPLMPGQGRSPEGDKDFLDDLPSKTTVSRPGNPKVHAEYEHMVEMINNLAKASSGERVVVGLSGGGGLASYSLVKGQGTDGSNIWARGLLYAPYYQNSGAAKHLADLIGMLSAGANIVNDWGKSCRKNRSRVNGRNGYCSVTVGASQAMVHLGHEASLHLDKVKVPVQFVGVEHDPTADNGQIYKRYQQLSAAGGDTSFCLYYQGVPHSIIAPKYDLLPYYQIYADLRSDKTPKHDENLVYPWVPSMEAASVDFITSGQWFPMNGFSKEEYGSPLCQVVLPENYQELEEPL